MDSEAPPPSYEEACAAVSAGTNAVDTGIVREVQTLSKEQFEKRIQELTKAYEQLRLVKFKMKKKPGKRPNQLYMPFFVSDQIVEFYKNSGLVLPEYADVLLKYRMATSGIVTSLFSMYIREKGLMNKEDGSFVIDDKMKKYFSDTRFVLNNNPLLRIRPDTDASKERIEIVQKRIDEGYKSVFELLKDRTDKKSGEPMYDEEKNTVKFLAMMFINNRYRIPNLLLSEKGKEELTKPMHQAKIDQFQEYLTEYNELNRNK